MYNGWYTNYIEEYNSYSKQENAGNLESIFPAVRMLNIVLSLLLVDLMVSQTNRPMSASQWYNSMSIMDKTKQGTHQRKKLTQDEVRSVAPEE